MARKFSFFFWCLSFSICSGFPVMAQEAEEREASSPSLVAEHPWEGNLNLRMNQNRWKDWPGAERETNSGGNIEFSQSVGSLLIESGAEYAEFAEAPWVRDQTRVSWRGGRGAWVLTAGDFVNSFRGFQNSFSVAGLSFKSGSSVDPDRIVFRRSLYELLISEPVVYEIYVDNRLFIRGRQEDGVLDLRRYALLRNKKNVRVRVTDDFGRVDQFVFDLFTESRTLGAGEHEFFVQSGYMAKDQPGDRAYDENAVLTTVSSRYGVNERLSLGLNFQNHTYRHLLGAELATLQGTGLYALDLAGTQVSGVKGGAARARWKNSFEGAGLTAELVHEERTEFFIPIRQEGTLIETFRRKSDVNFSKLLSDDTEAGLGYSAEEMFLSVESNRILRLDASHWLRKNLVIEGSVYQEWRPEAGYGGRISLSWFESPKAVSASVFHESVEHRSNVHAERPLRDDPWDFSLRANHQETAENNRDLELRVGAQSPWARVRAQSEQRTLDEARSSLDIIGLDSSLAWGSEANGVRAPKP